MGTSGLRSSRRQGRNEHADRTDNAGRGPHIVIGLGSIIMSASWVVFEVWGMIAGLVVGVILLDFGEQGALVSNRHVIYALRLEARNRLNTIFMGGMFVDGGPYTIIASYITATAAYGFETQIVYMLAKDRKIIADDDTNVSFGSRRG
jgi:hypothetical protein